MTDIMADSRISATCGLVVWLIWMSGNAGSLFEASWANALLLFAALILVPLSLDLGLETRRSEALGWCGRWALNLQLGAAFVLAVSCGLPEGSGAALRALPWLAFTGLVALAGGLRIYRQRALASLSALCINVGLIYLVVGGVWTVLSRYGARPLSFSPEIVRLTAVHFHYAGFVLPILTGLAARATGGMMAHLAALGVIAGVPLVAVGITAAQLGFGLWLEGMAAFITALAGGLTAGLQLRLASRPDQPIAARALWALSAAALGLGMVLAALYGLRAYWPVPWLNIPWMRAVHGSVNALGFALTGVIAWHVVARKSLTAKTESEAA